MSNSIKKNNKSIKRVNIPTKKIVITAMFTALSAIANSYLVIRIGQDFRVTLNLVVYFFAGIMLGAPLGFVVGVVGDLLGWLLFVDGVYNPIIAFSSGLFCAIPGLFHWLNKKDVSNGKEGASFVLISIISYVVCYLLCTLLLNSWGIWLFYTSGKTPFVLYMLGRAVGQLPITIANLIITVILYYVLRKIKYIKGIL